MSTRRTSRSCICSPLLCAVASIAVLTASCSGGSKGKPSPASSPPADATPAPVATADENVPGAAERASLFGNLTRDGAPVNAQFLGVRVIRDGLSAACQYTIPAVSDGLYGIAVVSDAEVRGCGAPGAEIVLWVYTAGQFFYSERATPWPGNGETAAFNATFSSAAPQGITRPVTELKGRLFDPQGNQPPGGTVIEAFVGDVRCGLTSVRYGAEVDHYYTLIVAGPETISGCLANGWLRFELDGKPVTETATNDLGQGAQGHELNFKVS